MIWTCDIHNNDGYISNFIYEHNGYDLTAFPALETPEYKIYSGDKIPGGIGDNLARMVQIDI